MPEALSEARQEGSLPCARCQNHSAFIVRTERLCADCLIKYVATKVTKRLEANKIRGGYGETRSKILIPLSLGISSTSLLHVLDSHLQKRQGKGRHAGYDLHLLFIDQSSVFDGDGSDVLSLIKQKFSCYPLHTLLLEDCFDYGIIFDTLLDANIGSDEVPQSNFQRLENLLSIIDSRSSKADVLDIVRQRLIVAFAKHGGFHSLLQGDTTTRLAERTLAEAAKGRGGIVPFQNADKKGEGGLNCIYPMRDLLRKELNQYLEILDPPLSLLILQHQSIEPVVSSKDNTIDGLMRQYINSVEQQYPSVVANVVRTTDKLMVPQSGHESDLCSVCQGPLIRLTTHATPAEILSYGRNGSGAQKGAEGLCYGCDRTFHTAG